MERKKILIVSFALVVLFASIFLIVKGIGSKNQVDNNPAPNTNVVNVGKPESQPILDQKGQETNLTNVTGSVAVIGEKTMTVKNQGEEKSTVVNINGSTPVMIANGKAQPVPGQMADLKKGDAVRVTYDKTTQKALMILVTRP